MIKAIIFDWGGTCTRGSIALNFSKLLAAMSIVSERRINAVFEKNNREYLLGKISGHAFWSAFAKETGIEEKPDFFVNLFRESGKADPDILSLVRDVSKYYETALLSDNYKELADHVVRTYRLRELFDTLVFSNREGVRKPSREIFQLTLKRLGVKANEAVFIDDLKQNVQAAKKFDLRGIHFTRNDKLKKDLIKLGIQGVK